MARPPPVGSRTTPCANCAAANKQVPFPEFASSVFPGFAKGRKGVYGMVSGCILNRTRKSKIEFFQRSRNGVPDEERKVLPMTRRDLIAASAAMAAGAARAFAAESAQRS